MPFKVENYKELVGAESPDEEGIWAPRTELTRDDGVRLKSVGSGPEGETYFLYTDSNDSFEFRARDGYSQSDPPEEWDYWEVGLGPALHRYSPSAAGPVGLRRAKEIACNVEEALMAWPRYASQPAIRQVKFLMAFWPQWNPTWPDRVAAADIPESNSPSS